MYLISYRRDTYGLMFSSREKIEGSDRDYYEFMTVAIGMQRWEPKSFLLCL